MPDLQIASAVSVIEAASVCEKAGGLVVIFDLEGLSSFSPAETQSFTRRFKNAVVIIVGRNDKDNEATEYLEAGATDFRIADSESLSQFCDIIERSQRGETCYGPERTRAIFARLQQLSKEVSRINSMDNLILTNREMEILQFVDEGRSNKQIAVKLHISLHTVKNHVHRILEKLHVTNRREAVRKAYSSGWLKMDLRTE
jgi:DNA-binding NarL/FixJ family response regulator